MVNDYINEDENISEVLNTVNFNEAEFTECLLHTPENHHLSDEFFAQNKSSLPNDVSLQHD